ncbi:MAG: hypothetical protein C4335_11300 [Armatimonadota bacterium]
MLPATTSRSYSLQDMFGSASTEALPSLWGRVSSLSAEQPTQAMRRIGELPWVASADCSSALPASQPLQSETRSFTGENVAPEYPPARVQDRFQQLDNIIRQEGLAGKVDTEKLLDFIVERTPSYLLNLPEEELVKRLRVLVVLEGACGALDEFSPEDIKRFDETVQRRALFE